MVAQVSPPRFSVAIVRDGNKTKILQPDEKLNGYETYIFRWDNTYKSWKEFYLSLHEEVLKGNLTEDDLLKVMKHIYDSAPGNAKVVFGFLLHSIIKETVDDLLKVPSPCSKTIRTHAFVFECLRNKVRELGISLPPL